MGREFQEKTIQLISVLSSANYNYILSRAKVLQAHIYTYSPFTVIIIKKNNNDKILVICGIGHVYIYSTNGAMHS